MRDIEKWFVEPQKKDIEGIEVTIHPLNIKHLKHFVDMESPEKMADAIENILMVSLKRSFPDITSEEIELIPATTLIQYLLAVMEVNGIDIPSDSEELIRQYKKKK